MDYSTEQLPTQPNEDDLDFPQGYPLTREHLHDVAPFAPDLQARMDEIMGRTGSG